MNGTITRRIDDLGRIVIPKELRKTLHILEGDEIEILPDGDTLVLKRFDPLSEMGYASRGVAKMISDQVGAEVYVLSGGKVVASSKGKKDLTPTDRLQTAVNTRSAVVFSSKDFPLFEKEKMREGQVAVEPISVNGDLLGAVVVVKDRFDENHLSYIRFASAILGAVVGL